MNLTLKTKLCSSCGEMLPTTEFYINRKQRDGYNLHCKGCSTDHVRYSRDKTIPAHDLKWPIANKKILRDLISTTQQHKLPCMDGSILIVDFSRDQHIAQVFDEKLDLQIAFQFTYPDQTTVINWLIKWLNKNQIKIKPI